MTLGQRGGRDVALLEVQDITLRFGGIVALDGLSFTIDDGQICGLIGPNGAGKTTMFNVVSRIYQPSAGRVTFGGRGPPRPSGARHRRQGHCPLVPEPGPVPDDDVAGERDGRRAQSGARRIRPVGHPDRCQQGEPQDAGLRRRSADPSRSRSPDVPSGGGPALRHVEAPRDRPSPGRAAALPADGRAGGRSHARRGRRARRHHPQDPRGLRARRSSSSNTTCRW